MMNLKLHKLTYFKTQIVLIYYKNKKKTATTTRKREYCKTNNNCNLNYDT